MSVLSEIRNGVMIITINRPEAGNSLNAEVGRGLVDLLAQAADNLDIRVVVVTGAGEKVFSAGMDLKAFAAGEDVMTIGAGLDAIGKCPKPVIAAVNGAALAGGFEVALKADLIVAAEHARFGLPEVKRGLFAAGGGTRLPSRIPLQIALELGLTGDPISAQRAYELGLVNRVVPAAELMTAALALAAAVAANGPLALQATKELMWAEIGPDTPDRVGKWAGTVFGSQDAKEGATAFAEKRAPQWKGR
jgi:enoyl-CoA hydratase/carnithine racemase